MSLSVRYLLLSAVISAIGLWVRRNPHYAHERRVMGGVALAFIAFARHGHGATLSPSSPWSRRRRISLALVVALYAT